MHVITDFAGKLSKVATQLRSLGEKIDDGVLVAKLLRAALAKFDAITSSIELNLVTWTQCHLRQLGH